MGVAAAPDSGLRGRRLGGSCGGRTAAYARLLAFFFVVYAGQGIANVWFTTITPGYIRSFGLGYEGSGVINTMRLLPWWAKVLVALPQDRVSLCGRGHRLPYVLVGTAVAVAAIAGAYLVTPLQWGAFLFLTCLGSYGVANADAAADGMAVDHAVDEHGSEIQGVMSAGLTVAALVFNAAAGGLLTAYGRGAAVWLLVAAYAATLPVVALVREERPPPRRGDGGGGGGDADDVTLAAVLRALVRALAQLRVAMLAAFLVLGQLGNAIASQPLDLWVMQHFGVTDAEFAYMNVAAAFAGLLGAVAAALVFDRVDKRGVLAFIAIWYTVVNFMPLLLRSKADVWAFWFANALIGQVYFVATSRMMVLYADRTAGATFFAVMASVGNFAIMAGTAIAGVVAQRSGADVCFISGSTINVFMLVPVAFMVDVGRARGSGGAAAAAPGGDGAAGRDDVDDGGLSPPPPASPAAGGDDALTLLRRASAQCRAHAVGAPAARRAQVVHNPVAAATDLSATHTGKPRADRESGQDDASHLGGPAPAAALAISVDVQPEAGLHSDLTPPTLAPQHARPGGAVIASATSGAPQLATADTLERQRRVVALLRVRV